MAWRVLKDGAMLSVVTGTRASAAGRDVVQTEARIYSRGDVPGEQLDPDLVERWEDGDAHLRSIIEPVSPFPNGGA